MLAWTIYFSFAGAALLMLLPRAAARMARITALIVAAAGLACALVSSFNFEPGKFLAITRVPWIPSLGIEYHLEADGISLVLVVLTGIAAMAGILFSWNIEHRANEFFALYLALIGGVYGVFLSFDLFLLFVFYEIAIIPKYFIIAIWGSTRREYGAMKLALYSFAGSAMVLIGLIGAFVIAGGKTMSWFELSNTPFPHAFQMWAFPLVFVGFGILAGLWPFHTWAPTGHVAAPTAASMLLAGVVMKLGAYGCLRVALGLFPHGLDEWGFRVLGIESWREVFALLAVIGIVYGAGVALVQRDFKFVIGYSSVSHMGFVLLGLMALNTVGRSGAVLQMFSHGIIAGLLFAIVGRMVYDRAHTRDLATLGELNLGQLMPFAAVSFTIAAAASMGLPGFSGFVAEFQVLMGSWQAFPTLTVISGLGILLGVAYSLRALQQAFFVSPGAASVHREVKGSPLTPALSALEREKVSNQQVGGGNGSARENSLRGTAVSIPNGGGGHLSFDPISVPERLGALMLIAVSLVVGLYPDLLLRLIVPSLGP
jgi:NADH-quinone oxidoreductase subunit M